MACRIMIVDDHRLMRAGIRALLGQYPAMSVVGEAADGTSAVETAMNEQPDIVLMDVRMPVMDGIEATRSIVREVPSTKVIALSMHDDMLQIREMLDAGAAGVLTKNCAPDDIMDAIKCVLAGGVYLPGDARNGLSAREHEVLRLLANGLLTKDIAKRLSLSTRTVEVHHAHICTKLGIHSIAELTKYAIRHGITTLEA